MLDDEAMLVDTMLPFEIDLCSICAMQLPLLFEIEGKSVCIQLALSFLTATINHLIRLENVRTSFVTIRFPIVLLL